MVAEKEWKCGFSEVAYNTFIRARSSLKDTKEVTDRTEGKAPQEIKHVGEIENILDIPKNIGLKNIILVNNTVIDWLLGSKPGTINLINCGANIANIPHKKIENTKNIFNALEVNFHASSSSFW